MAGDASKIAARFGLKTGQLKPRYNIAPTQNAAVVLCESTPELVHLRWGLIPSWAKDETIGNRMINARAETLLEKPSFRKPLQQRRCLVLADGFYEWKKAGTAKVPYRFTLQGGEVFAFAGLWDTWRRPDGPPLSSFTIITTVANERVQTVHDRMPVILAAESYAAWIDPECTKLETLKGMLQPYRAQGMRCYQVGTLINNPHADPGPEAITPVPDQATLL